MGAGCHRLASLQGYAKRHTAARPRRHRPLPQAGSGFGSPSRSNGAGSSGSNGNGSGGRKGGSSSVQKSRDTQIQATELLAKLLEATDPKAVAQQHLGSLDEQFFQIGSAYMQMVGFIYALAG